MKYSNIRIIDDLLNIPISLLNKEGVLKRSKHPIIQKVIRNDSIRLGVVTSLWTPIPFVTFLYRYEGKIVQQTVELLKTPSNLGKGHFYYFVCPKSRKKCRKLYLIDGCLVHRCLINGMYRSQTFSKKDRKIVDFVTQYYMDDKVAEEIYSRYFKTHYKGKPTKRLIKLKNKLKRAKFTLDFSSSNSF